MNRKVQSFKLKLEKGNDVLSPVNAFSLFWNSPVLMKIKFFVRICL